MSKVPEAAIDELYRLPLAAFTAARNELAKTVKGADAKRIKQLAKPTVVPWTINQLYWQARKTYDRVVAAGQTLRDTQIAALKGRDADVRHATEDHRKAIAAAVREGVALAAKEGIHPPTDQLARMLEAMSLARESSVAPGRLTELIQPSGFEALAGITPSGGKHSHTTSPTTAADIAGSPAAGPRLVTSAPVVRKPDPAEARRRKAEEQRRLAAERKREKETAAARARAEAVVRAAERELSDAREALARAERDVADARQAVADAERKLATARDGRVLSSPDV
jgi:hypothetical protein